MKQKSMIRRLLTLGRGVVAGMPEDAEQRDPLQLFGDWFADAEKSGLLMPEAMTLATATGEGRPSARMVLMKDYDEDGFVFFTNYGSRKAVELDSNPYAALLFHWSALQRQVRIEGSVSRVTQSVRFGRTATVGRPINSESKPAYGSGGRRRRIRLQVQRQAFSRQLNGPGVSRLQNESGYVGGTAELRVDVRRHHTSGLRSASQPGEPGGGQVVVSNQVIRQRTFSDEEIDVPAEIGEALVRPRVARIHESWCTGRRSHTERHALGCVGHVPARDDHISRDDLAAGNHLANRHRKARVYEEVAQHGGQTIEQLPGPGRAPYLQRVQGSGRMNTVSKREEQTRQGPDVVRVEVGQEQVRQSVPG